MQMVQKWIKCQIMEEAINSLDIGRDYFVSEFSLVDGLYKFFFNEQWL